MNVILGLVVASAAGIELRQIFAALAIGALGYGASITLWVKGARDLGAAGGQVIFATDPSSERSWRGPCSTNQSPSRRS